MKVTVVKKGKERETYPCLKIERVTDLVVLFTSSKCGTVVSKGKQMPFGQYYSTWYPEDFEPFHGRVTLSTE